jgi:glycosyltransferase 2 family protein
MAETPEVDIKKQFGLRRILLPVLIGVIAASYLLISNLNDLRYVAADPGEGTHSWVDANGNGQVDYAIPEEFVVSENGQYSARSFRDILAHQDWGADLVIALFLALLTVVLRDLGYIFRIRHLTDGKLSWRQSFDTIMLWEFASALTPSVVGGSGIAIFILNREGINLGKSTATVFVTALLDELFYVILVPIVILLVGSDLLFPATWAGDSWISSSVKPLFFIGYFFIVFLTATIFAAIFWFPEKFKRILMSIFTLRILRRWLRRATRVGDEVVISSEELKGKSLRWWSTSFGVTFMSWIFRFMTLNFLLFAFVSDFNQLVALGRQLVMWVIMLISPTPGSSGVAELALNSFFSDWFDDGVTLFLIAIMWRLLTYFIYLFVGVLVLPGWLKRTAT